MCINVPSSVEDDFIFFDGNCPVVTANLELQFKHVMFAVIYLVKLMLLCFSFVVLEARQIVAVPRTSALNILLLFLKASPLRCFDFFFQGTLILMGEKRLLLAE